ncbi:hypothetical protein [Streptomyces sp. AGS-58]|uniref:hypothetical protein n=1 Tax=unclassified Streptomyces TaxID=2593676 RepID=UPI0035A38FA6
MADAGAPADEKARGGARSGSQFWPLLPGFRLITSAVTLAAAAIQAVAGKAGTMLVPILLAVVGPASSGGFGACLLPVHRRDIGALFPPGNANDLSNSGCGSESGFPPLRARP